MVSLRADRHHFINCVMKPFPGQLKRSSTGCHPYILNDEQEAWLRETFPVTENHIVAKAMGTTWPTLYRIVKLMAIEKSEEGIKAIRQRQREWHNRMNRQARLLLLGGTTPSTCHNIRLQRYTKRQLQCRHTATKLYNSIVYNGYDLKDFDPARYVIYYDEETKRSARFEKTCAKHGLTIKEYE